MASAGRTAVDHDLVDAEVKKNGTSKKKKRPSPALGFIEIKESENRIYRAQLDFVASWSDTERDRGAHKHGGGRNTSTDLHASPRSRC